MRRSGHPSRPSATTCCCRFVSKTFPMPTLKHRLHVAVNVSVDGGQEMAGFEVSINGRFWVSTEGRPGNRFGTQPFSHQQGCRQVIERHGFARHFSVQSRVEDARCARIWRAKGRGRRRSIEPLTWHSRDQRPPHAAWSARQFRRKPPALLLFIRDSRFKECQLAV